jgi:DNA-damage-inducible protein J
MAKTATINARIEPEVKERAESIFAAIGISASEAISMFYRQVTFKRGLPFDVCIPNGTTVAALEAAERGEGEVFHGSTSQLFDELK